jgi:predicted O-methyltransferase YrrM
MTPPRRLEIPQEGSRKFNQERGFLMPNRSFQSPIKDARIHAVIDRLVETPRRPPSGGPHSDPAASLDPHDYAEYGFSIVPEQGELIYLLCRGMGAKRVVDFATSMGMSALYFAAAMRDSGGGTVIGSELVPAKIATAKSNLAEAGLSGHVEIREGDARLTLRDLGGPVDFVLIDGWPVSQEPSLAREVIQVVAPQLRIGGYVVNDNSEPDFLEFIRDSANGFISVNLPLKSGTELCVKVS